MIISMIRENKNNYYINLEIKNDTYYYNAVCTNKESTFYMNKEEISDLFRRIFKSNLSFLRKEGEYDLYLDEANNKRYFKDGKENLLLFLEKNGTPAIMYNSAKEENSKFSKLKNYIIKQGKEKILITTTYALLIISLGLQTNDNKVLIENKLYKNILPQATTEEIQNNIINSNDKILSREQRVYLANTNFINDVIETSDKCRNYILRKKTEGINLSYFTDKDKEEYPNSVGYYSIADINTIHLLDDSINIFHYAGAHEFIHLMQDNNEYVYIREASSEIMKSEYYKEEAVSYSDSRKRVSILMEMIGPKPIMECNFKGDTSTFEEAIYKNLDEKDAEELLSLFTISPAYDKKPEETNKKIDNLLAKIYKNITGNNITEDPFINYIYNNNTIDRVYFNQNSEKFYRRFNEEEYKNGIIPMEKLDYEKLKEAGYISKYFYTTREEISEKEYKNFIPGECDYVYVIYKPIEGYHIKSGYEVVSTDKTKKYTLEEAINKNLIRKIDYIKQESHQYNSLDALTEETDINLNDIYIQVLFKYGEMGDLYKSGKKTYVRRKKYKKAVYEPSIAEKFPDQVRKQDSPSYSNINLEELELMTIGNQDMDSKSSTNTNNHRK